MSDSPLPSLDRCARSVRRVLGHENRAAAVILAATVQSTPSTLAHLDEALRVFVAQARAIKPDRAVPGVSEATSTILRVLRLVLDSEAPGHEEGAKAAGQLAATLAARGDAAEAGRLCGWIASGTVPSLIPAKTLRRREKMARQVTIAVVTDPTIAEVTEYDVPARSRGYVSVGKGGSLTAVIDGKIVGRGHLSTPAGAARDARLYGGAHVAEPEYPGPTETRALAGAVVDAILDSHGLRGGRPAPRDPVADPWIGDTFTGIADGWIMIEDVAPDGVTAGGGDGDPSFWTWDEWRAEAPEIDIRADVKRDPTPRDLENRIKRGLRLSDEDYARYLSACSSEACVAMGVIPWPNPPGPQAPVTLAPGADRTFNFFFSTTPETSND